MITLVSLRRISNLILFTFLFFPLPGQNPYRLKQGAEEAGMGAVCLTNPSFTGCFQNQALLPDFNSLTLGVNYENRFNIKELGTRTIGLVIPMEGVSLGAVYSHFGYSDFYRTFTGIAAGTKIAQKVSAGIQIDYITEKGWDEYSGNRAVTFEAGITIAVAQNSKIAVHLFNPLPNSLRKTELPSTISLGVGSQIVDELYLGAEMVLNTGEQPGIKTGFTYEAAKNLKIRGGFSSPNNSFTLGIGYALKPVKIDFAFITHESLGLTSMVSLQFMLPQ